MELWKLVLLAGVLVIGGLLVGDPPTPSDEPNVEDISLTNGDVTLSGTLTLPDGSGPHPAVVLVSGSGPQDRDGAHASVPGYRPFKWIAEHLARKGIATLRYDERGVGESTGDHLAATTVDLADDAEAALEFLIDRAAIDPDQVGILGHSEGGLIAPMIAARNPDVAFVISMAGPAVDGYRLLTRQAERGLTVSGASEEEIAQVLQQQRAELDLIVAQDWDALERMTYAGILEHLRGLPWWQKLLMGDLEKAARAQVATSMTMLRGWLHFFVVHDPAEDWAQVRVPVLALFGGLDVQVDVEQNRAPLEAALARAGNGDVTVAVFPEANHLFQKAATGNPENYASLPMEFAPGFLATISDWLLAVVDER